MKIEIVKIGLIKPNPNNPRVIKDENFKKLVKSIVDFPKMLEIRPIVVNSEMVVLGGNMRLKACKEAGLKEVPLIKAEDLTEEEQREFIIKDNVSGGEWNWEILTNEWDYKQLEEWGIDVVTPKAKEDNEEIDLGIYPLSIILNSFEYKKFNLYKKENSIKSDTEAFHILFNNKHDKSI
jgi:hypothetical protein